MHSILAVDGTFSPSDMHYYTLSWVKFYVPHGFPLLKLVQVMLKLLMTYPLIKRQVYCNIICKQTDLGLYVFRQVVCIQ